MIDVVKLPDALDMSKIIRKKMTEVYGTCPYCEESLRVNKNREDTGTVKSIKGSGIFRKKYEWERLKFECRNCGMEWMSPEYPIVSNDTDANNAIFHAWQNGKNMEVNTLLLGCLKEQT